MKIKKRPMTVAFCVYVGVNDCYVKNLLATQNRKPEMKLPFPLTTRYLPLHHMFCRFRHKISAPQTI